MKTNNFFKRFACAALLSVGALSASAQGDLILVSGTDFTPKGMDSETYTSWELVEAGGVGYLGIIKPQVTINKPVVERTEFTSKKSDFISGDCYAITNNPCKIDSFRFYDTKEDAWGILLPRGGTSAETFMSLKVNGLKGASDYRVEIDYCFVADYSVKWGTGYPGVNYNTGSKQVEFGGIDPKIRFVVNPDQYNTTSGPDVGFSTAEKTGRGCAMATVTPKSSNSGPVSATGELQLNINTTQQTAAIFITAIRVYADVSPKISGVETVCAGGEKGLVSVGSAYLGATYQWYKDGAKMAGETGMTIAHTSDLKTEGSHEYYYEMQVDDGTGKKVTRKSPTWTVEDIMCCQNDDGSPASRKLIYVNDFGTFSADGKTLTVWDFSDLSNPTTKDITKVDRPFVTNLPAMGITAPEGASKGTCMEDDGHSVVGWISDADGSKIGWAAQVGGTGEYWGPGRKNGPFFPDHTDQLIEQSVGGKTLGGHGKYGAALLVNAAKGDHSATGIRVYKQEITGICEQTHLTVKCYINNYSDGKNPVDIQIRAYDSEHIGDPKFGGESPRIVRYADGRDGYAWKEVSVDIPRIESKNLTFEILNFTANGDGQGDDLILDDILVYACSSPSVDLYFSLDNYAKDTVSCQGDDVDLYVDATAMLTNYYGSDLAYLYQYTTSDADPTSATFKKSWKNLNSSPVTATKNHEKIEDVIEEIKNLISDPTKYPTVKFRVVAGMKDMIEKTMAADNYFNPDDPCSNMSISKPIELTIDCPTCTEPLEIKISSTKEADTDKKIYLCYGESTTLTTNNVVPEESTWASSAFKGYTIDWSVDGTVNAKMTKVGDNVTSQAADYLISNDTELTADEEHVYSVLAYDTEYPTFKICQTEAEVTVVLLARPKAEPVSMEFCQGKPAATDVLPADDANYTVTFYKDALATVEVDAPDLATLEPGTYTYYYTKKSKKGCESETAVIDIVVNTIPTYVVPAIDPFCAGQSTETSLPETIADSTITWTPSNPQLNTLEGKTTPYSYSYVVTSPEGCESKSKEYTVTVLPSAKVVLTATPSCEGTTVVADITPKGATAVWSGVATAEKTKFEFGVDTEGDLIVTVPKSDEYCEHADTVAIELWPTPSLPSTNNLTYLKKQTPFKNVQEHNTAKPAASIDAAEANNKDAYFMWTLKGANSWSKDVPTPTVKNAADPETEILTYEVKAVNDNGCESKAAEFVVEIFGAPVPLKSDTTFCLDATAATFDQFIKEDKTLDPTDTYTIHIYEDADMKSELPYTSAPATDKVGKKTYYATQEGKGGESKPVSFVVNTIGVKEPTIANDNIVKCNTDAVETLVATNNVDETNSYMSNGVVWSSDGGATFSATAPTTSTTVGVYDFVAKETYKIPNTSTVCESKEVPAKVTIDETTKPGDLQVTYVLSDAEKTGSFIDIISQYVANGQMNPIETGYTYEFTGILDSPAAGGSYSATAPSPAVPSKTEVDGGSITKYVSYRRTKQTGGKCVSESATITITISDSPMPEAPAINFCEGETISSLDNYVKISTGKKTADKYELRWFGTTKPASSADEGSTAVPTAPATTVSDPTAPVVYTYYVAQKDLETKAIGSASALVITVYPKPVQVITPADAECEASVNLANQVTVSNTSAFGGASVVTEFFSDATGSDLMTPATATKQGDYYAKSSYSTPNATISGSVCASAVEKIEVIIPTLEFSATDSAQTCPNLEAILSATAKTNVDKVTFNWAGGTDTNSDVQSVSGGEASSKFTTALLKGVAGDTYKYNLTVTAGKCTKEKLGIVVTLGDGPVEGSITLMESSNSESPKTYLDGNTTEAFYTCGGSITAQVSLKKTEGEFTWSNGQTGETVNLTEPGKYTISYVNKCATSVSFEVKDASIKNNALTIASATETKGEGEELRVCAGEDVKFNLDFFAADAANVQWTLEDKPTSLISDKGASMSNAQPSASGEYGYIITSHGCEKKGTASLKVKPYVEFAPMQDLYVVERGKEVEIKNVISVPLTGTPSNITWFESNKGTNVSNTSKDYTTVVDGDYNFVITMSDNDYCESQQKVKVIMDASLQVAASIQPRMCRGDKDVVLIVDTTGTGKFYYDKDWSLVVYQVSGGNKIALNDYTPNTAEGTLLYPVAPAVDATYEVNFLYRQGTKDEQKASADASITVLQPIEMEMPKGLTVCGGSELDINLVKVEPAGVIVDWEEDASIISGSHDTETITILPEYDEEEGTNHKMVKRYNLVASYDGCADKKDFVDVTVYEPISGELLGDTICEGNSTILSASSFQADTWTWKLDGAEIGNGQTLNITPEETAEYYVVMSRGEGVCVDSASTYVFVNSNPVIISKDSLSYRSVRINLDYSYGTSPYEYLVKGVDEWQSSNVFDSLSYHKHEVYVKDAVGCMDTFEFTILPPEIKIPNWFSPEGDGMFDIWEIPSLAETYPNAEVKIFDRWGKLIGEFLGSDLGWDGKYNGVDMPSTDYWYEIHVRELDKIFTGHFTLIRR